MALDELPRTRTIMPTRLLSTAALMALLALGAGCANPAARVPVLRPAPVNLSAYDLVAVDRFEGPADCPLEAEIADALRRSENPLTGQVEYEVLSRQDVDQTVSNLRVGGPGQGLDDRSMAVLERWRSAEVLIRGHVAEYDVSEDVVEQRSKDSKGNVHISYRRQMVVTVAVEVETTEPGATGDQAFDRVTFRETASASTQARDPNPPSIRPEPLLADARRRVVAGFLARVLPRQEFVTVELRTASKLPQLKVGNGYAQVGDWDAAIQAYQEGVDFAEQSPDVPPKQKANALYNLGLALGFANRFDDARNLLRDSYALDQNQKTLAELQAVDRREAEYAELANQGMAAEPGF